MNKRVIFGAVIIIAMLLVAIFAPFIATQNPLKMDLSPEARLASPSLEHFFGTDSLGRDVYSRMVYGSRVSLSVGFIAVFISLIIGIFLGGLSGYHGGWVDILIMRLVEIMYSLPVFFLIMMVIAFLGPNILNVMIIIGLVSWAGLCRLVRAEFLTLRERDFVHAAKLQGVSDMRIIFRHILPNAMAPVYVSATLSVGSAVLVESSLSFLGLGVQIPTPSWGNILTIGKNYIDYAWWLTLFPGLAILVTVLSFNMLGEGLREILDPKLRERKNGDCPQPDLKPATGGLSPFFRDNALQISDLTITIGTRCVIDNVSLVLEHGKITALVGESGSGKTLLALSILDLLPSTAYRKNGSIFFEKKDIFTLSSDEKREIRGAKIAMVPQEPFTALNPVMHVGIQIVECLTAHKNLSSKDALKRTGQLLEMVKLPQKAASYYPHELSGGMRQRVMLAMALSCEPKVLILDEATTALDVSVQKEILDLIQSIQKQQLFSILFITHDFSLVNMISDIVYVMRQGKIIENGMKEILLRNPRHDYTQHLIDCVPRLGDRRVRL